MNAALISRDVVFEPADNKRLANLCGQFDEHLRQIEDRLKVEIASRGNRFRVTGKPGAAEIGGDVLLSLFQMTDNESLDPERVHMLLQESVMNEGEPVAAKTGTVANDAEDVSIQTRQKLIRPRGPNQTVYLQSIRDYDLAFGVGTKDINDRAGHQVGLPPAIDGQVAERFCAVTPKQIQSAVEGLLTKNEIGSLIMRLEQIKAALTATDTNGYVIPRVSSDLSGMDDWANVDDSDRQTSYFARDKHWQLNVMKPGGRLLAPVEAHHCAKDRLAELIAAAEKTSAAEAKEKLLATEGNHPDVRKRIKK